MNGHGYGRVWAVSLMAALLLCVLAGPFGTIALPLATRTLFWVALIGVNAGKWWLWYRWLAPRAGDGLWPQLAVAGAGALLLNATLPLEIAFLYRAVGLAPVGNWFVLWATAAVISASISAVIAVALSAVHAPPAPEASASMLPPQASPSGLALKLDITTLHAITAEDHYLRLHLDGGQKPLLLYRFGDAVADLASIDGLQVHRSAWVAARAVTGASKTGRRWSLILADGTAIPVSNRHLPAVRARGWLDRR